MIVCVSCEEDNSNETLCSLNFAARARNAQLGPAKSKASGVSDAKLRERERELEASREAVRNMEFAYTRTCTHAHTHTYVYFYTHIFMYN